MAGTYDRLDLQTMANCYIERSGNENVPEGLKVKYTDDGTITFKETSGNEYQVLGATSLTEDELVYIADFLGAEVEDDDDGANSDLSKADNQAPAGELEEPVSQGKDAPIAQGASEEELDSAGLDTVKPNAEEKSPTGVEKPADTKDEKTQAETPALDKLMSFVDNYDKLNETLEKMENPGLSDDEKASLRRSIEIITNLTKSENTSDERKQELWGKYNEICNLLYSNNLSEEEMNKLLKDFDTYASEQLAFSDEDIPKGENGAVDPNKYFDAVNNFASQLYTDMNTDGQEGLNQEEFNTFAQTFIQKADLKTPNGTAGEEMFNTTPLDTGVIFNQFDIDSNGVLDKNELAGVFTAVDTFDDTIDGKTSLSDFKNAFDPENPQAQKFNVKGVATQFTGVYNNIEETRNTAQEQ